jgi:hypothetical protein
MTKSPATRPIPPRTVPTRRIDFSYPEGELPRHYVGGDLVMSHIVTTLSSLFPEGEDFFVRSVRNYRDRITDPELKRQVGGFIGQESIHGREHRAFNERLGTLGYPTRFIDRTTKYLLLLGQVTLPKKGQLAITAALEHYTATLAEVLMSDPKAQAMLADTPEVQSLFLWHAMEESEHKSVAFDVYEAVSGNRFRRAMVMNLVTVWFIAALVGFTTISLLGDRATYNPRRLGRSLAAFRRSPWISRSVRRRVRSYNKRGFHPDDIDATELLTEWRTKLFSDTGRLADRMKRPDAAAAAPTSHAT